MRCGRKHECVDCSWDKTLRCPALYFVPSGFLGEGDAVTKAIQDARQLLHSHSGALENSPSAPFRKVWATLPRGQGQVVEEEDTGSTDHHHIVSVPRRTSSAWTPPQPRSGWRRTVCIPWRKPCWAVTWMVRALSRGGYHLTLHPPLIPSLPPSFLRSFLACVSIPWCGVL